MLTLDFFGCIDVTYFRKVLSFYNRYSIWSIYLPKLEPELHLFIENISSEGPSAVTPVKWQ